MARGKQIGYIRVSTIDQNPDRQLQGIKLDKKFIDYASGNSANRPQLKNMLDYARDGDIIYVHSLDRLARRVKDIRSIVDHCLEHDIEIHFIKENLHFVKKDDPISICILNIMATISEFEYSLIKERQMEGIQTAKLLGKYKGKQSKLTPLIEEKIRNLMKTRTTKQQIAKEVGISRECLYRYIKKLNIE